MLSVVDLSRWTLVVGKLCVRWRWNDDLCYSPSGKVNSSHWEKERERESCGGVRNPTNIMEHIFSFLLLLRPKIHTSFGSPTPDIFNMLLDKWKTINQNVNGKSFNSHIHNVLHILLLLLLNERILQLPSHLTWMVECLLEHRLLGFGWCEFRSR